MLALSLERTAERSSAEKSGKVNLCPLETFKSERLEEDGQLSAVKKSITVNVFVFFFLFFS